MKKEILNHLMQILCMGLVAVTGILFVIVGSYIVYYLETATNLEKLLYILNTLGYLTVGVIMFVIGMIEIYRSLHVVKINETGVTCKFLWKVVQSLEWSEIQEWGIGRQYSMPSAISKNYNPLPKGDERFLLGEMSVYGKKYIYISTKKLSEEEKINVYAESFRKKGLLTMKYSDETYIELFKVFSEELCQKNFNYKSIILTSPEKTERSDTNKQLIYFIDYYKGLTALWWISILVGSVACIFYMELKTVIPLIIYGIGIMIYLQKYFRKVIISEKGVTYRNVHMKKVFWKWEEIYECAVLRDSFERGRHHEYAESRYIYFSKIPFGYKRKKNKSFFSQHFKMKDIVMVRYSDKLYWYLKSLGVLGIKE